VANLLLSLALLGAAILFWGGIAQIRRSKDALTKGVLMIVAALVLLGNVLIWAVPIS
jgi:hypothetical protein